MQENPLGVLESQNGDLFQSQIFNLCNFFGDFNDITWFIPFAAIRNWRDVRSVGFK